MTNQKTFKRKPKTEKEFFGEIDTLNNEQPSKNKTVGRAALSDHLKTIKTSVSIRTSEQLIIDNTIDSLVNSGIRKPFPNNSEIFRMAIALLGDVQEDKLTELYIKCKNLSI